MKKINQYKLLAGICLLSFLTACDYERINTNPFEMTEEEGLMDGFAVGGLVTAMEQTVFQWVHKPMIQTLLINIRLIIIFRPIVGVVSSGRITLPVGIQVVTIPPIF